MGGEYGGSGAESSIDSDTASINQGISSLSLDPVQEDGDAYSSPSPTHGAFKKSKSVSSPTTSTHSGSSGSNTTTMIIAK